MEAVVKWSMTPELFSTVYRVVNKHDYRGLNKNLRYAIKNRDEFRPAKTPADFMEVNHIELIEGDMV